MSLDFMNTFLQGTQKETIEGVQKLIDDKKIKEKMLEEAQKYAQQAANHILDESQEAPKVFEGIDLSASEDGQDTEFYLFMLVLDYLESIGLKFAPTVFRYESQNPSVLSDRLRISNDLLLRYYDKTPLLVQMIEQLRLDHQK